MKNPVIRETIKEHYKETLYTKHSGKQRITDFKYYYFFVSDAHKDELEQVLDFYEYLYSIESARTDAKINIPNFIENTIVKNNSEHFLCVEFTTHEIKKCLKDLFELKFCYPVSGSKCSNVLSVIKTLYKNSENFRFLLTDSAKKLLIEEFKEKYLRFQLGDDEFNLINTPNNFDYSNISNIPCPDAELNTLIENYLLENYYEQK